ncbi:hypothetical protein L313_0430 [Acinetobacter haemolyticus CIP 64.3 = MTCC 9819]|nr:hypothetical protein L313_0430 [Acinetobacter haemolyticus CIP 64.3 = MTCC 9819]
MWLIQCLHGPYNLTPQSEHVSNSAKVMPKFRNADFFKIFLFQMVKTDVFDFL